MKSESCRARLVLLACGGLLGGMLLGLTAVCWRLPPGLDNIFGYSPATLPFFATGLGLALPAAMDVGAVQINFTGLWLASNLAWLAALWVVARCFRSVGQPHPPVATNHKETIDQPSEVVESSEGFVVTLVMGLAALFNLGLVIAMPPALSTDIYNYLAYGRMLVFYGLNPYVVSPSHMAADPVLQLHSWDIVTHYGPLWTYLAAGIARLAGRGGIFAGVVLFKVCAALSHLVIAWLGYRLARAGGQGNALAALIFVAWNPLLLLEGAGNGHNDLLMMALALAGLLAYQRQRSWLGYALVLMSALVKFVTLLLLFFYVLAWLLEQAGWAARLRLALLAGLAGLLALAAAYTPFWQGLESLVGGIAEESTHIMLSPIAVVKILLVQLGQALSLPGQQVERLSMLGLNVVQKGALVALVGWNAYRLWRRQSQPLLPQVIQAWGSICLIYICFLHNSIFAWYFVWPLATSVVDWQHPTQRWVLGFSAMLGAVMVLFYAVPI